MLISILAQAHSLIKPGLVSDIVGFIAVKLHRLNPNHISSISD